MAKDIEETKIEIIKHMRQEYRREPDKYKDRLKTIELFENNSEKTKKVDIKETFGFYKELKDGTIKNHRQLLAILSDDKNYETLRKGLWGMTKSQYKKATKDGSTPETITAKLIEQYQGLPDWSRTEKIMNIVEMTSGAPDELVFPASFIKRVREKDVQSVFEIEGGAKGVGWFCASEVIQKTTKKGKAFLRIRAMDDNNNTGWIRVWGKFDQIPDPYTLWIGEVDNDANWGMASTSWKLKQIRAFE